MRDAGHSDGTRKEQTVSNGTVERPEVFDWLVQSKSLERGCLQECEKETGNHPFSGYWTQEAATTPAMKPRQKTARTGTQSKALVGGSGDPTAM